MNTLENLAPHCIMHHAHAHIMLHTLSFPSELNSYKISFLSPTPQKPSYNPIPLIPSFFWHSRTFLALPSTFFYRKKFCTRNCASNFMIQTTVYFVKRKHFICSIIKIVFALDEEDLCPIIIFMTYAQHRSL